MKQAVIFGITGVLCDPTPFVWESRQNILSEYGVTLREEEISAMLGQSLQEQLKTINKKYGLDLDFSEFSERNKKESLELMKGRLQATKGAEELVKKLLDADYKIGIASQNIQENILTYLQMIGLGEYFETIVSVEELTQFKPNPELFLKMAKKLGVKPHECIVLDDSVFGLQAAKKAGMKAIGVTSEYSGIKKLENHCEKVVVTLNELNMEDFR